MGNREGVRKAKKLHCIFNALFNSNVIFVSPELPLMEANKWNDHRQGLLKILKFGSMLISWLSLSIGFQINYQQRKNTVSYLKSDVLLFLSPPILQKVSRKGEFAIKYVSITLPRGLSKSAVTI